MVLSHAHAVGDLAGPAPEGRLPQAGVELGPRNPYRLVALDVAELEDERMREADETATDLAAGPGHPMCLGCSAPIDAAWNGGDTACATCGLAVHGARPGKAMPVDRGLVAILRRLPAPAVARSAVALTCPTCNAPLTAVEGATQVTCKYCQGTSRLPPAAAVHATREPVAVDAACWMLFQGPSRRRGDLQSRT
jgi:LSD1 subclass zinc finger protein